jgi:hypothetical protein
MASYYRISILDPNTSCHQGPNVIFIGTVYGEEDIIRLHYSKKNLSVRMSELNVIDENGDELKEMTYHKNIYQHVNLYIIANDKDAASKGCKLYHIKNAKYLNTHQINLPQIEVCKCELVNGAIVFSL